MTPSLGIKPGPHWWEASALTTAPSLHNRTHVQNYLHATFHFVMSVKLHNYDQDNDDDDVLLYRIRGFVALQ